MEGNGIDIGLEQFKQMKAVDRDTVMFQNFQYIRKKLGDYDFNKKLQYYWLGILTIVIAGKRFFAL